MIPRVGNPESGSGFFRVSTRRFPTETSGSGISRDLTPDLHSRPGSGPDQESRRDPDEISGLSYFARFSVKQPLSEVNNNLNSLI